MELLPLVIPGAVAAAGVVVAHFVLEPIRQRAARRLKLAERRFEAQQKLVAALTRLDQATAEYEDRYLLQQNTDEVAVQTGKAYREALFEAGDARFFLTEEQYSAVIGFLGKWADANDPVTSPSAANLIREQFGPERALELPMKQRPRLKGQSPKQLPEKSSK